MSKKPFILVLAITAFVSIAASGKTLPPLYDHPAVSRHMLDTGGRTVSLDSAQACIDRYTALMAAHGFSSQAGQNINIRLKKTVQITTGETFNGQKLLDWLSATNAEYTAAGKNLMVKIQFGVYDANYLSTYQPDAALRQANNNRIAVFIIPYDASSGQAFRAMNAVPAGGTGGGGTGFDLGGVQP